MTLQMNLVEENPEIEVELQEIFEKETGGTRDYEKLNNLPTLNGKLFVGEMNEKDPTVPEWAKQPTKPAYSSGEVGAVSEKNAIPLQEIKQWFES